VVTYTTLRQGCIPSIVQGATSRGAWSEPGLELARDPASVVEYMVVPCVLVAAFLAFLWALYRYRLHQMRRNSMCAWRSAHAIARELHDTLLQTFHVAAPISGGSQHASPAPGRRN